MPTRENISVRTRLLLHAVLITGAALALAGVAAIYLGHRAAKERTARDLRIRAETVAGQLPIFLGFGASFAEDAEKVLAKLRIDPNLAYARIYDARGNFFAQYPPDAERPKGSVHPLPLGTVFSGGRLVTAARIPGDDEDLGTLEIGYDLDDLRDDLRTQITIGVSLLLAALAVAFLLAFRLQRSISAPILHLATVARRIADRKDYSVRARKSRGDEIGSLTDAFNGMLSEIETRDRELERRVEERTMDLDRARQAAEAASGAKSQFLANVSHEIRTPMTSILGYADLLLDPALDASDRINSIQTIRRNGEHLLTVLNDVLDLSKIEAGRMTIERIPCSPARIVVEVASLVRGRAAEKGLALSVKFEGPLPETICTDPTRLRQILLNLAGNALKFTEEGTVRLVVSLPDVPPGEVPTLRIDVIDEGIGMSEEQIGNLFTPFTQADASTTRRFGGTGLGLTISQRFARELGGTIRVESDPDRGSTFTVTVATGPLEGVPMLTGLTESALLDDETPAIKGQDGPASSRRPLKGLKLLLAEDGPDNQLLISQVLKMAGAAVEIAGNGRIAHDTAMDAWKRNEPFDLVLMDMQMPEMDGYSATALLRSHGYKGPIVALTAHAMIEDRAKCLKAGCDEYTTKPIDRNALIGLIVSQARRRTTS